MKEMTTKRVINCPSNVSMRMLFIVGDGVNELRNSTSESHDGRRGLYVAVTFEGLAAMALVPDIAGKNKAEKAFLMTVRSSGSPDEKLNMDETGDCTADTLDAPASAVAAAPTFTEAFPFATAWARLLEACCWGPSAPDQRPSASQKSALQMALMDHGNHPSQTNATRTNRSHVTIVRKL